MAYGITQSATLNGSSQYFSRADAAVLRVVNGWTVESWIKPSSLAAAFSIVRSRTLENGWGISVNTDGTIRPEGGSGAFDGANSTGVISVGLWWHIKVVFNTSSTNIYINGTLDSTVTIPSITNPNATIFWGSSTGAANFLPGQMSLIRIWGNDHGGTDDKCTFYGGATTNMNAEWSLNNSVTDTSGNGNDLTNNGTITFALDVPATCSIRPSKALIGVGI